MAGARAAAADGEAWPSIKGFLETSFIDWRGSIAAVLFLPGCNFACPFCHNHTLVSDPDSLMTHEWAAVRARLEPFVGWIDGVVITGGEPTLHRGLTGLMREIRSLGFKIKLDTNGYRPGVLRDVLGMGLVTTVAMDVKAPLDHASYSRAVGKPVEVERVRESLGILAASGLPYELRTTIWPAWHGEDELKLMARDIAGAPYWTLQAMDPTNAWRPEELGPGQPYDARELARLQTEVADPACSSRS